MVMIIWVLPHSILVGYGSIHFEFNNCEGDPWKRIIKFFDWSKLYYIKVRVSK